MVIIFLILIMVRNLENNNFLCELNKDIYSNMLFFSQEETYMFWTQPPFTCPKWTMNTIDGTAEYVQS